MQNTTKTNNKKKKKKKANSEEEDSDYYFEKRNNNFFSFFSCCGPPAVMDVDNNSTNIIHNSNKNSRKTAAVPVPACSKMEREGGGGAYYQRVFPGFSKAVVAEADRKKRKLRRNLKAVLFETSLAKTIRRRKILRKLLHGKSSSAKPAKYPIKVKANSTNAMHAKLAENTDRRIISDAGPSTISNPMSVSKKNQSFQSNSLDSKRDQINIRVTGKGSFSSNSGLYLLLASLLILVLWGKACAIVFTSAWLFFVPRWNSRRNLQEWIDSKEFDSVEYKRRIVMEGLLERKRCRGLRPSQQT